MTHKLDLQPKQPKPSRLSHVLHSGVAKVWIHPPKQRLCNKQVKDNMQLQTNERKRILFRTENTTKNTKKYAGKEGHDFKPQRHHTSKKEKEKKHQNKENEKESKNIGTRHQGRNFFLGF